jgi:pilus assembly protein CpaE
MRLLMWDHLPSVLLDGRRMAEVLGIGPVLGIPLDRAHALNSLNGGNPMALAADTGAYGQAMRRAAGVPAPSRARRMKWPALPKRLPWRRK